MTTKTTVACGAMCALLAAPAFAADDHMMSSAAAVPVRVTQCGTSRTAPGTESSLGAGMAVAWISFTNVGDRAIDRIAFDLERGNQHYLLMDSGRFAPGAKVEHRLMNAQLPDSDSPATCTVVAIHYTNGTSWMR